MENQKLLIEALEDLLSRAKSGELLGLAYFAASRENSTCGFQGFNEDGRVGALAELGQLAFENRGLERRSGMN